MIPPPERIISGRRTAGGILVLSALTTVIMLVILLARCSADPPPSSRALVTPSPTPTTTASAPQQTARQQPLSAQAELQQEVAGDRPRVETLIGSWVPQLSSKFVGLKADGITYGHRDILDHFNRTKIRYPDVLILYSGDYTSYTAKNYWVVVRPIPYNSGSAANAWGDNQRIDPDNCFAKLLLHTGGPDGTTLSRK